MLLGVSGPLWCRLYALPTHQSRQFLQMARPGNTMTPCKQKDRKNSRNMSKNTHMLSSLERTVEIIVAELPHTTFVLGKNDTEQLLSLLSLPDIPMPDIGRVINVCWVATLLPLLILFFHGRQVSVRVNIRGKYKSSRVHVVTEVCSWITGDSTDKHGSRERPFILIRICVDRIRINIVGENLWIVISRNDVCEGAGTKPEAISTFLELYVRWALEEQAEQVKIKHTGIWIGSMTDSRETMYTDFAVLQSSIRPSKLEVDLITYFFSSNECLLYGTKAKSPEGLATACPGRPSSI